MSAGGEWPGEGAVPELTQQLGQLGRREQNLQAAAQERQQVVGKRAAEEGEVLLLPGAQGRLLRPVEGHDVEAHLQESSAVTQLLRPSPGDGGDVWTPTPT